MSAEIFYAMFLIVHVLKLKIFQGTRAPPFHPEASCPFLIASLYEFGPRETHRVKSTAQACFCVMGLLQYVTKKASLLVKCITPIIETQERDHCLQQHPVCMVVVPNE